ncbi:MAG: crossover junction endodeoxyribonuclease RuvC [Firmicutes bacterium]|nr:crossover junction endodeoxyribonuclease RuvC [Bacillota bacterium]
MRILGIDPGYGTTGFGLIESERGQSRLLQCGAITTPPGMEFSARLEVIYEDMRQLLAAAQPDAVAIEELFFGQNVTTGIGVAQSRGVILLAIRQAGLEAVPYKPSQVKQALVGYGNATKHQMMDMTRRLLHLEAMPKPDDAADAIAIALCHARSSTSLLAQAAGAHREISGGKT